MIQSIQSKKVHNGELEKIAKCWIGEHNFYLYTPLNDQYGWKDNIEATELRRLVLKYKIVYVYVKREGSLCMHSVVER